jgi:Fis family transcriptional regulator
MLVDAPVVSENVTSLPVLMVDGANDSVDLSDAVKQAVDLYLQNLGSMAPVNLYDIVLETVEEPLLRVIMQHTRNNQVKSAKVLGIARGTLRTLLKKYGMLS